MADFFFVPPPTIDKTLQAYKTSTIGQVTNGRSTPARSLDIDIKEIKAEIDPPRARGTTQTQSWENEGKMKYEVYAHGTVLIRYSSDSQLNAACYS